MKKVVKYVTEFEPVFLYLYAKKHSEDMLINIRETKSRTQQARKRIEELDRLIMRVYEDHALGNLSESRYSMMATNYEAEQAKLREQIEADESALANAEKSTINLRAFLKAIRQCTDFEELDEKTVNTLISKIEVFKKERIDGKYHIPIKIHFTAVGIINIPDEKEILSIMEEIRNNPKLLKTA